MSRTTVLKATQSLGTGPADCEVYQEMTTLDRQANTIRLANLRAGKLLERLFVIHERLSGPSAVKKEEALRGCIGGGILADIENALTDMTDIIDKIEGVVELLELVL